MNQAQIGMSQAQTGLTDAQTNLTRMETLYAQGAVSLVQYEQAKSALTMAEQSYDMAKQSYSMAEQGYNMARQNCNSANDALGNYVVTAPIGGYVTSVNVQTGGMASQSVPAITIADIDKLEIDTSISETMINKISVGDKVDVIVSSVSSEPFTGTVTALSPAPATGTLTYPMKITLDNSNEQIKPGMFAEVVIVSDKSSNVIAIPSEAVLIKSGKTVVAIIKDDKVTFSEVTLGVDNGQLAEITSGVSEGDVVVTEGQSYLSESSEFKIIE